MRLDRAIPTLLACALLSAAAPLAAAKDRAPGFAEQSFDLPGMPAAIVPADMNGDGRDDLVVLVAYTSWGEVATTEQVKFDDIEGLVEVMSVVSSLVDRRELRVYLANIDGEGFEPQHLSALELDSSVHALQAGHPDFPLLALTDEGVAAVNLVAAPDGPQLSIEPLLSASSSLTGTGSFFADFQFLHDIDGDQTVDLLLPTDTGWSIHPGIDGGFGAHSVEQVALPPLLPDDDEDWEEEDRDDGDDREEEEGEGKQGDEKSVSIGETESPPRPRAPRQPRLEDINNDGHLDLVLFSRRHARGPLVFRSRGNLRFDPAVELTLTEEEPDSEEHDYHEEGIVFVGDLDGDGRAEAVSQHEIELVDAGFKEEIRHAKRPDFLYRVYELSPDLELADTSSFAFQAQGYTFEGEDEDHDDDDIEIRLPGGFKDLDGDGRLDLVAITLDFSLVPLLVRALLGSISLRMDFHPHCQADDGQMLKVPNLDLSGKFKINFRNLQIKHLSQFQGDFNGDGRADFIQLGRGKKVTIHQGGPECTYPIEPDHKIRLAKEPKHLGLVRILDLDGDAYSDIYVVHPQKDPKSGETAPVRLDLYLAEDAD